MSFEVDVRGWPRDRCCSPSDGCRSSSGLNTSFAAERCSSTDWPSAGHSYDVAWGHRRLCDPTDEVFHLTFVPAVRITTVLVKSDHTATCFGGSHCLHQGKFTLQTETPRYKSLYCWNHFFKLKELDKEERWNNSVNPSIKLIVVPTGTNCWNLVLLKIAVGEECRHLNAVL